MHRLGLAWCLILGEHMQEHVMDAATGIGRDAQAVEREFDTRPAQTRVGSNILDMANSVCIAAECGRGEVAEGVGGILPGFILKGPPAYALTEFEGLSSHALRLFQKGRRLFLTHLTQLACRLL